MKSYARCLHHSDLIASFSYSKTIGSPVDIVWIDGHEFRFCGNYYDVVNYVETQDSIKIFCINDKNEKRLVETFISMLDNSSPENNGNIPTYLRIMLKLIHADIFFKQTDMKIITGLLATISGSMAIAINPQAPEPADKPPEIHSIKIVS